MNDDGSVSWIEDGEPGEPGTEWHITEGPPTKPYRTVHGRKKAHPFRGEFLGTGVVWLAADIDQDPGWVGYFGYSLLVLMVLQVWVLIDGIVIPATRWQEVRRPKVIWLLLITVTSPIGSLYYLLRLRPRLRR